MTRERLKRNGDVQFQSTGQSDVEAIAGNTQTAGPTPQLGSIVDNSKLTQEEAQSQLITMAEQLASQAGVSPNDLLFQATQEQNPELVEMLDVFVERVQQTRDSSLEESAADLTESAQANGLPEISDEDVEWLKTLPAEQIEQASPRIAQQLQTLTELEAYMSQSVEIDEEADAYHEFQSYVMGARQDIKELMQLEGVSATTFQSLDQTPETVREEASSSLTTDRPLSEKEYMVVQAVLDAYALDNPQEFAQIMSGEDMSVNEAESLFQDFGLDAHEYGDEAELDDEDELED